jgi:hypothetical protein
MHRNSKRRRSLGLMAVGVLLFALSAAIGRCEETVDAGGGIVDLIHHYAGVYGVAPLYLEAVARCESDLDATAVGAQGEIGVMQFHPRGLWPETPLGRAGLSLYEATVEQHIEMAAWAFGQGLGFHWACS